MQKADLMTIGHYLSTIYNLDYETYSEDSFLEKLGRDFCIFVKDTNFRRILKKLNFDLLGKEALLFGLENKELVKDSKFILVRENNAQFKARIINEELKDITHEAFFIQDMYTFCKRFLVIDNVESIQKDAIKNLLSKVLKEINIPVVINVGYLYYGEYVTQKEFTESRDVISKLIPFYEELGFVDVNKVIGCYEESVAMAKANDTLIAEILKNDN